MCFCFDAVAIRLSACVGLTQVRTFRKAPCLHSTSSPSFRVRPTCLVLAPYARAGSPRGRDARCQRVARFRPPPARENPRRAVKAVEWCPSRQATRASSRAHSDARSTDSRDSGRLACGLRRVVIVRSYNLRSHHRRASIATSVPSHMAPIRGVVSGRVSARAIKRGFQPRMQSCSSQGARQASRESQCSRGHVDALVRCHRCLRAGSQSSSNWRIRRART